jgi:hypothetical protein
MRRMKMNDNKKELISQDELYDIMYNYLKPELDKFNSSGCSWAHVSRVDTFYWNLYNNVEHRIHTIGSCLYNDYWGIYNDWCADEYTNIKIYTDHVEFIEESKFTDFDRDFMRGLYDKIKEYIEYNNTTNRTYKHLRFARYLTNSPENAAYADAQNPGGPAVLVTSSRHEYLNDYNTYVDKLYGPSCKGEITRKKRDVPLKAIEEICKDNGVKWKPNNDNPNNNIKVDSNAEVNTFGDGAVRSSKKGKGRYDLIPGCVMVDVISSLSGTINHMTDNYIRSYKSILLKSIYKRNWVGAITVLTVLGYCNEKTPNEIDAFNKMQKDLALHYENGAEIYGENNWKKGIPIESFISSGIRHTQQYLSGLTDEPHLISAIWNFCNAAWCEKKEELYK